MTCKLFKTINHKYLSPLTRFLIALATLLVYAQSGKAQDFAGQVYTLADVELDSDCEVQAECDCCASDLAFMTANTFALVVRCLSGDTYYTGTYEVTSSEIILTYKQFAVSELLDDDYKWQSNEKKEANLSPDRFNVDTCDNGRVLRNPRNHHFKSGSRLAKSDEARILKELATSKALKMFD